MSNVIRDAIFQESQIHSGNIVNAAIALANKIEEETPASLLLKFGNDNTGRPAINLLPHSFWCTPDLDDVREKIGYTEAKILQPKTQLGKFVRSLAQSIQFPENTAYAHALGCVAVAAGRQFTYSFYGPQDDNPVNLYIVTAQPPSTGKSAINSALLAPIREHYKEVNHQRLIEQLNIQARIADIEQQLKKDSAGPATVRKEAEMIELQEEVSKLGPITIAIDDATPEAMEIAATAHGGMVNTVSDEADAINVMLGSVYSDRKSNSGIFLKAWDKGYHSPARASRSAKAGHVWGTIAVIAQDESIDTILEAGKLGRGIPERILVMRERNLLGTRIFTNGYTPVDKELKQWYSDLVRNLVNEQPTNLEFNDDARTLVNEYRAKIEGDLADGGQYSNTMLRGALGKADKQICRLACIYHLANEWAPGGKKRTKISPHTVCVAIEMFDQFKQSYVDVTTGSGVAGNMALMFETAKVLRELRDEKKKGSVFGINVLRQSSAFRRKGSIFSNTPELTDLLRSTILPALHDQGVIVFDGDKNIAINPNY